MGAWLFGEKGFFTQCLCPKYATGTSYSILGENGGSGIHTNTQFPRASGSFIIIIMFRQPPPSPVLPYHHRTSYVDANMDVVKECYICLEPFDAEHPPTRFRGAGRCQHIFGAPCLREWCLTHNENATRCPMCRAELFSYEDNESSDNTGEEYDDDESDDELFTVESYREVTLRWVRASAQQHAGDHDVGHVDATSDKNPSNEDGNTSGPRTAASPSRRQVERMRNDTTQDQDDDSDDANENWLAPLASVRHGSTASQRRLEELFDIALASRDHSSQYAVRQQDQDLQDSIRRQIEDYETTFGQQDEFMDLESELNEYGVRCPTHIT